MVIIFTVLIVVNCSELVERLGQTELRHVPIEGKRIAVETATMPPSAQAHRNALRNYGTTITSPIRRKKLPGTAFPLRISSYCTGIST